MHPLSLGQISGLLLPPLIRLKMTISDNILMDSIFESSSSAVLLSSFPFISEALFTNFSLEPTWRWYFTMTPFETIFLGFIILQFAVLNMFGIMPINISALLNGMPEGRRKRDTPELHYSKQSLGYQMLKLMKKLDPDECTLKSLCEVEGYSCSGNKSIDIPTGIKWVLSNLKQKYTSRNYGVNYLSLKPSENMWEQSTISEFENDDSAILKIYEEAVALGGRNSSVAMMELTSASTQSLGNSTVCGLRYPRCPLDANEILGYITQIHMLDKF